MTKKTPNWEKPAERRCWVGREEKSCGLSQDQEGLSISSQKKLRLARAHLSSVFGWEEKLLRLNHDHWLLQTPLLLQGCSFGEDGRTLLHPPSDVPQPSGSRWRAFSALPSFLGQAEYHHNEPRQDLGAGGVNPTT